MSSEKNHFSALDGLRGLAAIAVILKHLASRDILLPSGANFLGSAGVMLFFVLSGFLMSYLYIGKPFNRASLTSYVVSRASRIAPLYLSVIIASAIVCAYFYPAFVYQINSSNLLRHLLFSGNVSVFWSIAPEVQFYIFFVVVWWAFQKLLDGKKIPAALTALACCFALVIAHRVPGTTLPSKLHLFMSGVLVGYIRHRLPSEPNRPQLIRLLQPVSLAGFVVCTSFVYHSANIEKSYQFPDDAVYFSALCTALCSASVFLFSFKAKPQATILASEPLRSIGAWSFSLYLLHEPILQLCQNLIQLYPSFEGFIVAGTLSVVFATSAFVCLSFEKPVQRLIKGVVRDRLTVGD